MTDRSAFGPLLANLEAAEEPTLEVLPPPAAPPASVALLAGSFDPITVAHTAMAEAARNHAELVVLLYSVRTLAKEGRPGPALLDTAARLEALSMICAGRPWSALGLCSHGLLADQVVAAAARFSDARILLVVGSDKVLQLFDPAWYADREAALDRLFANARILYAVRSGEEEALARVMSRPEHARWRDRFTRIEIPAGVAAVSSRMARERLRRGEDVRRLIPPEVRRLLPAGGRPRHVELR